MASRSYPKFSNATAEPATDVSGMLQHKERRDYDVPGVVSFGGGDERGSSHGTYSLGYLFQFSKQW